MTTSSQPRVRILTIGTGAIGAYYTWVIQRCGRTIITAVCRSNYEAVKAGGIEIQTTAWGEGPHIFKPDHVVNTVPAETYDYIIVCMKFLPKTYDIAAIIEPAVKASPNASIVLIQNGLGVEEPIQKRFPRNPILSAVAYIGVTQNTLGVVYHSGKTQRIIVGLFKPVEGNDGQRALEEFGDLCRDGGLETIVTDDIQNYRWQKLVWNAAMNPACIVSGLWTVSNVLSDEKWEKIALTTKKEITALATALGYKMPDNLVERSMITSRSLADGYKASMIVDLEAGRPIELEAIITNPIHIAEEKQLLHLIPTWYGLYKDMMVYLEQRSKV
ncbi:hypothetical protein DFQ27_007091 [Actinomortierella ambigua]|uniref:2-dehydropantoate 2-reductase n=1 Tax=Actinomortierella ambigua TaxID=1343610 RepID=A0A9P6TZK4_9FUNG|nr:hypothetical protein DFQ27_007091 [Actinomortierella ambigua]